MAKNAFEELLESIPDETDRKAIADYGEKYKELKDGRLRQSEFSRRMNELAEEKKSHEADIGQLALWRDWRKTHWVDDGEGGGMTAEEKEARDQLAQVNQELETLKAAQEAGMTFDEVSQFIETDLKKRNVVTKADLDGRFVDKTAFRNTTDPKELKGKFVDASFYKEDSNERINSVANGLEYIVEHSLPLMFQHKEEFGEIIKPRELITFMNENGFKDIDKAYDVWVGPKRQELSKAKYEKDLAEAEKRGEEKALKNNGLAVGGKNPADQGAPVMSHLQRRLTMPKDQQDADPVPENMELGKGVGGIIAQQYRKDVAEGNILKG
jgi:hypothetical protein